MNNNLLFINKNFSFPLNLDNEIYVLKYFN